MFAVSGGKFAGISMKACRSMQTSQHDNSCVSKDAFAHAFATQESTFFKIAQGARSGCSESEATMELRGFQIAQPQTGKQKGARPDFGMNTNPGKNLSSDARGEAVDLGCCLSTVWLVAKEAFFDTLETPSSFSRLTLADHLCKLGVINGLGWLKIGTTTVH